MDLRSNSRDGHRSGSQPNSSSAPASTAIPSSQPISYTTPYPHMPPPGTENSAGIGNSASSTNTSNTFASTPTGPATSLGPYVEVGAELDRRLQIEEHQAKMRLLAAQTAAAERANQQADAERQRPTSRSASDLNDLFGSSGTLSPEVLSLVNEHKGVSAKYILQVVNGKFNPIDTIKLCPGTKVYEFNSSEEITLEDGKLGSRKRTSHFKDYGNTDSIYVRGFVVYTSIMDYLHGRTVPGLQRALLHFLQQIQHYATVYDWQRQILPLAIQHHTTVIIEGATNIESWKIPPELRDQFCLARLEPIASAERSQSRKRSRPDANTTPTKDQICNKFNSDKGCDWAECRRRHECNICEDTAHGAPGCKTKRRQ